VTFAAPKRGMFLRDGPELCGEVWIGDISAPIEGLCGNPRCKDTECIASQTTCSQSFAQNAHSARIKAMPGVCDLRRQLLYERRTDAGFQSALRVGAGCASLPAR
jgi:hypothetical protein